MADVAFTVLVVWLVMCGVVAVLVRHGLAEARRLDGPPARQGLATSRHGLLGR